ncbi:MAG: Maf family protein [Bryobacteraceae bacterium]
MLEDMLVLASKSPRRSEILKQAGFNFAVRAANVSEDRRGEETPVNFVKRLAAEKARAVQRSENEVILGADTIVLAGGEILGKPKNAADAGRMLQLLSGRRHEVLTGICLRTAARDIVDCAVTKVFFSPLNRDEISTYVASGEPMDKAGAYAIQGLASKFVERIDGCYFNVVGLPVSLVYRYLSGMSLL